MKGFAKQNTRVTQRPSTFLRNKFWLHKNFFFKFIKYLTLDQEVHSPKTGGKHYQMRVVELKRGCFLPLKISCRVNFPPLGPDLILPNMNALATCLQHATERRLPNGSLWTLLGRSTSYLGCPVSGSTKAVTWPTYPKHSLDQWCPTFGLPRATMEEELSWVTHNIH